MVFMSHVLDGSLGHLWFVTIREPNIYRWLLYVQKKKQDCSDLSTYLTRAKWCKQGFYKGYEDKFSTYRIRQSRFMWFLQKPHTSD